MLRSKASLRLSGIQQRGGSQGSFGYPLPCRVVMATLVKTTVTYELYAFDAAGNVSDAATLMVTP